MNWLISYPRSGNTAARYVLEMLTGKPSTGVCYGASKNDKDILQKPLIHKSSHDYFIRKGHTFDGVKDDDFVLFLIRDPLEAVIRHNEKPRGLTEEKIKRYLDDWFNLLMQYSEHSGHKMLWYYDELVKIASKASKDLYPDPQSNDKDFHKSKLNPETINSLKAYIQLKHSYLVNEYLK